MLQTSPSSDILQDFDEAATMLDFLGTAAAADTDPANLSFEFELTELPLVEAAPVLPAKSADAASAPSQDGDAGPPGLSNRERTASELERNRIHQRNFREKQRVSYDAVFADSRAMSCRLITLVSLQSK